MVAPIHPIRSRKRPPPSPTMRRAHQLVAATLLRPPERRTKRVSRVRSRKAWLLVAWVAVLAAAGIACAVGLF